MKSEKYEKWQISKIILSQLFSNCKNTYNFHFHKNKIYSLPLGRGATINYYF